MTFVYSDSTAVVGPLATVREPHSWDLCVKHAGRITAPRGWELVRHAAPLAAEPANPDDDDLVALADAVREGGRESGLVSARAGGLVTGFATRNEYDEVSLAGGGGDPQLHHATAHATAPSGGLMASHEHRSGRRRGHLRVLPDPSG